MPDRYLKESICTSDTLDMLSWFEEVFWYRLTVNCDDFGRFDARPSVLKSRLFPIKAGVTEKNMQDALNKLSTVGLVITYVCDGKPYLQLVTWSKHQRTRAKKSKYPAPNLEESASNAIFDASKDDGCHLTTLDVKCRQMSPIAIAIANTNTLANTIAIAKKTREKHDAFEQLILDYTSNKTLAEALFGFVEMRKKQKGFTEKAAQLALSRLDKLSVCYGARAEEAKTAIVNQTIENSWKTFYELKFDFPEQDAPVKTMEAPTPITPEEAAEKDLGELVRW